MSGVGGETIIGEEDTLAVLAGPVMSGVCVGCGGRDHHWRGRHACRAGRSSDEWCLCRVCGGGVGGETIIGEEDTLAELAGPVMSGVCVGCGGRDHHWRGRHACRAGRSSDEWCLCRVWGARPSLERKTRLQSWQVQ